MGEPKGPLKEREGIWGHVILRTTELVYRLKRLLALNNPRMTPEQISPDLKFCGISDQPTGPSSEAPFV